ncbi:MAG: hypothetical protein OXU33_08445 [Gemmatimonadota bacterium]|nr:hypothetical protein [Gemmatimonadota bacterium]MDE3006597.1 hypothetical protein [Gemmatimonadota bacterium]MDE3014090.1 hypothetical protein [Gemmatimonadota bacterium]
MSLKKQYDDYSLFSDLKPGADYRAFALADELGREPVYGAVYISLGDLAEFLPF